jgi:hypothetical protein
MVFQSFTSLGVYAGKRCHLTQSTPTLAVIAYHLANWLALLDAAGKESHERAAPIPYPMQVHFRLKS